MDVICTSQFQSPRRADLTVQTETRQYVSSCVLSYWSEWHRYDLATSLLLMPHAFRCVFCSRRDAKNILFLLKKPLRGIVRVWVEWYSQDGLQCYRTLQHRNKDNEDWHWRGRDHQGQIWLIKLSLVLLCYKCYVTFSPGPNLFQTFI